MCAYCDHVILYEEEDFAILCVNMQAFERACDECDVEYLKKSTFRDEAQLRTIR